MNYLFSRSLLFFYCLLILSACNTHVDSGTTYFPDFESIDFMAFDSVQSVKNFPYTYEISSGQRVSEEVIGMWSFEIEDDLLFISTTNSKGMWKAYKLPDFEFYGEFLNVGDGPKELAATVAVSDKVHFDFNESQKLVQIYDFQRGRLLKLDIDQSKIIGRDSIQVIEENLSPFLLDFLILDSGFYFLRKPENLEKNLNRYLDSSSTLTTRKVLEVLNNSNIGGEMNLPILYSMTRLQPGKQTIVEMYFRLNYFNLYALDGSVKKTICIEDELDKISSVEALEQMERKYRFSDVRAYDDYFALLHLNEVESDFSTERKSKPEILFFDWEGNPLAKIVSEEFFTAFDLDLNNQLLYTFDSQTDYFLYYDLSDFNLDMAISNTP